MGCETIAPIAGKLLGTASKDGISLDAQVGDRKIDTQLDGARATGDIKAEDDAVVNVTNSKTDAQIQQADKVTVQNIPPWVFLLALIGWLLPTPQSMFKCTWDKLKLWRKK